MGERFRMERRERTEANIRAFFYDADGRDKEFELPSALPAIEERQLLWVDVVGRNIRDLETVQNVFELNEASMSDLNGRGRCPLLNRHGEYFHCGVWAIADRDSPQNEPRTPSHLKMVRLDLLIGRNWLITVQDEKIAFLSDFREENQGETMLGALSSASLAAALLDLHLTRYLGGLAEVEDFVDSLDVKILGSTATDASLLKQVLDGRRFIASLRRQLAPQQSVFYGLSRPDFALIADAGAGGAFRRSGATF